MESQYNSQKRKPRLKKATSMNSFTAKPCCLSKSWCPSLGTFRGLRQLRQCPDRQSVSMLVILSRRRGETRRESGPISWVFAKSISHVARWLRVLLSRPGPLWRTFTLSVQEVLQSFTFELMHHRMASGDRYSVIMVRPKHTGQIFPSSERRPCMAGIMGTSCNFDLVAWVRGKLLDSRAQVVVQSEAIFGSSNLGFL